MSILVIMMFVPRLTVDNRAMWQWERSMVFMKSNRVFCHRVKEKQNTNTYLFFSCKTLCTFVSMQHQGTEEKINTLTLYSYDLDYASMMPNNPISRLHIYSTRAGNCTLLKLNICVPLLLSSLFKYANINWLYEDCYLQNDVVLLTSSSHFFKVDLFISIYLNYINVSHSDAKMLQVDKIPQVIT